MAIAPGQSIGQYRIVGKLGEGGMGAVYKADQPSIKRTVAVKVLSANFAHDPDALGRFQREVDIIAGLEHPHILPVYDFGELEGNPYIVMRFMGGGSLLERLRAGRLEQDPALRLLDQMADALDYAHGRNVIHRDLKPANVLLDEAGNAYLADFGLAKTMAGTDDLTRAGTMLGTPAYMSPEQARGEKLDARSDVYSFAVLVFQVLAGQLPFTANSTMEYIHKHLTEPPPSILTIAPTMPPAVDSLLRAALAKDRAERPERCGDLMRALRAALAGAPVGAAAAAAGLPGTPGPSVTRAAATRAAPTRAAPTRAESLPAAPSFPSPTPSAPAAPVSQPRPGTSWALPAIAVVGVGGLLLVVAVAVVAFLVYGRGPRGAPVHAYPVGDSPRAILVEGDAVWVASFFDSKLTRLSAANCGTNADPCGQSQGDYPVDNNPVAMVSAGGALWVASALHSNLTKFDPAAGQEIERYPLKHVPTTLLFANNYLWTANGFAGTVTQVALDGAVAGDYPAGGDPVALAFDGQRLWVASQKSNALTKLDGDTGDLLGTYPISGGPRALAFDGQSLWVALADSSEVAQVDPASGEVLARVPVGARPEALLWAGGSLWTADLEGQSVTRIDPATAKTVATLPVGAGPYALAWASCGDGCNDLWLAIEQDDAVRRVRVQD